MSILGGTSSPPDPKWQHVLKVHIWIQPSIGATILKEDTNLNFAIWPATAPFYPHSHFFSLTALFLLFPRLLFVITGRLELRLPADEGRCGTKHKSPM